jgi:hypothetical protein
MSDAVFAAIILVLLVIAVIWFNSTGRRLWG